MHKSAKKSKDKSTSSSRNDDIDWNYDNLLWDGERQQSYWEGRKNGKRVRKYQKHDDFQGGNGSQDTYMSRGGTHGMGDMGVDENYSTPQDYRPLDTSIPRGGSIGGITQGMGNLGVGDTYAPQDTIPRSGNIGDIPQGMGDMGADDNYATPQEYSYSAPGTRSQNTHPDDLGPPSTFPQTSGSFAPTTTTLGTDAVNPNVPPPDAPYPNYSTPHPPYAEPNEYPLDQLSHSQHHRRGSDADQYQHQQFDDGSTSGKHHRSGKKDKGQRKGKGDAGGDQYPEAPFYGSNEPFDPREPSYPPGQSQPDYDQSQTGDDDYQPTRESRRDKGKGRAAAHDSHGKHHRSRGHGGGTPSEGSYGSGSGADLHQGQSEPYYGDPIYPQDMYGGVGSGGTLEPIPEFGTTGDPGSEAGDQPNWDQTPADDDDDDPDHNPELKAAMEKSAAEYYSNQPGHINEGGPSQQRAYGELPDDPYAEYDRATTPNPYGPGVGTSTPAYVTGTPGEKESLDPRYKVEPSGKFAPGEVFKILWYEPKGSFSATGPPGGGSKISDVVRLQDHYKNYFVGFRRFIVVANDEGHCTCVPILTYDKQGCNKKGVKPKKHGIIYAEGDKPRPLKGEPTLGFDPIRMRVSAKSEKISRESRVNYSKLVTIEHNVKVFFVGRIHQNDFEIVSDAVDTCWKNKSHGQRKNKN